MLALLQAGGDPESPPLDQAFGWLAEQSKKNRHPRVWLALAVGQKLEATTIDGLLRTQRLDGSWGSLSGAVLGIHLLAERGYHSDSNRLRQTLEKVYAEQCADGSFGSLEETALVLGSLRQAGLSPTHPMVARAYEWLEDQLEGLVHSGNPEAQLAYGKYLQWKCEKG